MSAPVAAIAPRLPAVIEKGRASAPRATAALRVLPWALPMTLFALWYLATTHGWASEQVLVAPATVWEAARELVSNGELATHLSASLVRLGTGFGLGAAAALIFGIAMGASRSFEDYVGPLFNTVRQVPTFALIPAFILIFGVEEVFKIVLVAKATFYPIAIASFDGVRGIPRPFLEVARLTRLSRWDRLRRLILPATLPTLATGIRISLGRSWMVLVAAELIAADAGIGQMMETGRQMFRMDIVVVGVFVTGG
ncbi:MAG TPA: ABC transporter permease, partial [Polyangia bacterium]